MTREVHAIPPAPRRSVRWSAALWHRWPLALAGFLFAVYGGLWTLMLWFASSGKPIDDARLDAGATTAAGEALEVEPTEARIGAVEADRVHYRFAAADTEVHGRSFGPRGARPGAPIEVEYLADAVHVNRIKGGRLSLVGNLVTPAFWITIVPGALATIAWAVGALRMRRLLVHGDVAVARIESCEPIPLVVPAMLRVCFTFRDRQALERRGHQWVRVRSTLGARLQHRPGSLAVVHSREHPNHYRLVASDEFAALVAESAT